jgi:hypothetical protein
MPKIQTFPAFSPISGKSAETVPPQTEHTATPSPVNRAAGTIFCKGITDAARATGTEDSRCAPRHITKHGVLPTGIHKTTRDQPQVILELGGNASAQVRSDGCA